MGRLNPVRIWKRLPKVVRSWLPSFVLVLVSIAFFHIRTFANQQPSTSELQAYLASNQLKVGEDTVNGYRQIYYDMNGIIVYVTKGNSNHSSPRSAGPKIVWLEDLPGGKQVFLYDVLTRRQTQLTFAGAHQNPQTDGTSVVWEVWTGDSLQIELSNAQGVRQISSGSNAIRPQVQGDKVAYTKRVGTNTWSILSYSISTGQTTTVETVSGTQAYPRFVDGQIKSGPYLY